MKAGGPVPEQWEKCVALAIKDARPPLPTMLVDQVRAVVKDYADSREFYRDCLYGIEEKVALDAELQPIRYDSKKAWWRAVIDRVWAKGAHAKISDIKTGFGMKSDRFQLECYAWTLMQLLSQVQEVECEFDYIRLHHQETFVLTRDDEERIFHEILARTEQAMNDRKFKPIIGDLCRTCGAWRLCPEMKTKGSEIAVRIPTAQSEAEALIRQFIIHDKAREEIRGALKDYGNLVGEFHGLGKEFYFSVTRGWKGVDVVKLLADLNTMGLEPGKYLKPDTARLRKLADNNETIRELMDLLGEPTVKTTFRDRKYKPKEGGSADESAGTAESKGSAEGKGGGNDKRHRCTKGRGTNARRQSGKVRSSDGGELPEGF